jgi:hypothetical protein
MPTISADARLDAYVSRCIALAPLQPDPRAFLLRNAECVEQRLRALAADIPLPGLEGLTAWALSDAAEALEAEAVRLERGTAT